MKTRTLDAMAPLRCDTEPSGAVWSTFPDELLRGTVVGAADGSVWAIDDHDDLATHAKVLTLERFDARGVSLARRDLTLAGRDAVVSADYAPAPHGGLAVHAHVIETEAENGARVERGTLWRFDAMANPVLPPVRTTGLGVGRVRVGALGTVTVAGTALLRFTAGGALDFSQPAVPGLASDDLWLDAEGSAALVTRRSVWNGGTATFGIAAYDAAGNHVSDWSIPFSFADGYPVHATRMGDGTLAIRGSVSDDTQVILGYARDGTPRFAWTFPSVDTIPMMVDSRTGAVATMSAHGMIVIARDGAGCRRYDYRSANSPAAGTLTFSDGWTFTRQGLPDG